MISVDDKFIGPLYWGGAVKMEPGQHLITVKMSFNRGLGTGPFEAQVALRPVLLPAQHYVLNGSVEGVEVTVWVEDAATGVRVGESQSGQWRDMPRQETSTPIFIPIKK
jgi:hypothetical protein